MHNTLDIILPCYNPPEGWLQHVQDILKVLQLKYPAIQLGLIIVNDGSTINFTTAIQARVKTILPQVHIINMPVNGGKGKALRAGVQASNANYILYTDIDIPFSQQSITNMLDALFANAQVVIGNRLNSYDNQLRNFRKILSRGSHFFNKIILRMPYTDTQAGLKAFDAIGKKIFLQTTIDRYLFDTEFVLLAHKNKACNISVVNIETKPGIIFSKMGFAILKKEASGILKLMTISIKKNK
jgi:glycosyltransferase involved in cell wall biosynthesis